MSGFIEAWGQSGVGLRVEFIQRNDRVAHVIKLVGDVGGEEGIVWLTSAEGDAKEPWPASPPLQSLHIEERPERRVALLVGLAGKSHWSLSVEPIPGEATLCFDVACRIASEPQWLGSRYQVNEAVASRAEVNMSSSSFLSDGELLEIAASANSRSAKLPQTVRWTYLCRLRNQ